VAVNCAIARLLAPKVAGIVGRFTLMTPSTCAPRPFGCAQIFSEALLIAEPGGIVTLLNRIPARCRPTPNHLSVSGWVVLDFEQKASSVLPLTWKLDGHLLDHVDLHLGRIDAPPKGAVPPSLAENVKVSCPR